MHGGVRYGINDSKEGEHMSIINHEDRTALQERFHDRLYAAQDAICKEMVTELAGRQILVERRLRNVEGEYAPFEVAVTVTDARLGYDDALILRGTYTNPVSGKIVETEVSF
jgi:hypothetical protein